MHFSVCRNKKLLFEREKHGEDDEEEGKDMVPAKSFGLEDGNHPHDMRMTKKSGQSFDEGTISSSLSWPYHAKVIKMLETINKRMV